MILDPYKVSISNEHPDDYGNRITRLTAEADGEKVTWKVPDRMLEQPQLMGYFVSEICAELSDRLALRKKKH